MKNRYNSIAFLLILPLFGLNSISYAQDITPVQDGDLYSFQVSDVYFEVDAGFGAHISSLMLGDEEIMFLDRNYGGHLWGSTFWHSPQSEWGWPPATVLDEEPYSGGIAGNSVVLESGTENNFKVSFTKTLFASSADTSVTIVYNINNRGSSSTQMAPWEVTRVPGGGITFWPMGEGSITGDLSEYTEVIENIAWYGFTDSDIGNRKFFSDGADGWLAHVNENSILFVKQFAEVPYSDHAPGEGEIELWLTGDHVYIELENQGVYEEIPVDYMSQYEVRWYVRQLPENISPAVGNQDLVNFVYHVIGDPISPAPARPIAPITHSSPVLADRIVVNGNVLFTELPAGQFKLEVFDLTGKLIQSRNFYSEYQYRHYLNSTKPGVYIYRLSGKDFLSRGKLIIR